MNLDGIDLTGLDLRTIQGTPRLTQLTANPAGDAATLLPALPYNADPGDLTTNPADLLGSGVSIRNAMVMLKTTVTVGELNTLLARHQASIVASSPKDDFLPNAVLMARFNTTSAQELYDLTVALNNDPIVEAAAPDVVVGPTLVPSDANGASARGQVWHWDEAGMISGGNWGLEYARVPQMWNVLGPLQQKHTARVPTCIIDDSFIPTHEDLQFSALLGAPSRTVSDHGMHVSGIVGATHGNTNGVDGVNPLAQLIGYHYTVNRAYTFVQDVRDVLRLVPEVKVINMSVAFGWSLYTNNARPTITSPFPANQLDSIESIARKYGLLMAGVAYWANSVLIVAAAANDFNLILGKAG